MEIKLKCQTYWQMSGFFKKIKADYAHTMIVKMSKCSKKKYI